MNQIRVDVTLFKKTYVCVFRARVTCSLVFHTYSKPVTFVLEFYQQQGISPVASRENQTYSDVTDVAVYGP